MLKKIQKKIPRLKEDILMQAGYEKTQVRENKNFPRKFSFGGILLIAFLGFLLSFAGCLVMFYIQKSQLKQSFEDMAIEKLRDIEKKLSQNMNVVRSLQAFYISSQFVDRQEFKTFSQNLLGDLVGVRAAEWLPKISDSQRAAYEQSVRSEGGDFPGISEQEPETGILKLAQKRDYYFPIDYIEPYSGNERAVGFDLNSEYTRRETLNAAIRTGRVAVSPAIDLIFKKEKILGFLMIGAIPGGLSSDGKTKKQEGFVAVALEIQPLLQSILSDSLWLRRQIRFEVFEDLNSQSGRLLYSDSIPEGKNSLRNFIFNKINFLVERKISFGGQSWLIRVSPTEDWLRSHSKWNAWVVLLVGGFATLGLTLYVGSLMGRGERFEKAVEERTEELARTNFQLMLSEKKFRTLVSNVPGVIYRCAADAQWTMEFLSESIIEIIGFPATDFVQNKIRSFASTIHENDRQSVDQIVSNALKIKKPFILEYRLVHADGSTRWVYEKGQGVLSEDNRLLWFDGVIFDITDKHKLAQQAAQSQKMEAIGKLAGGIAHDFNNQLMVISGYCDFLLKALAPEDPKYDEVQEIKKAGEKAAQLTRQLLSFGRRQVVNPKNFDLRILLNDLQKILKSLVGEKITLNVQAPEDQIFPIRLDPAQFEQVFFNLTLNAKDAMPEGGTLTFELERSEILTEEEELTAGIPRGEYVVLSVRDNGVGMSEQVKSHLFEPFFSTKEKGLGTGLGLATCYGIVRSSGGFIQAQSKEGAGSEFRIYLPLSTKKPELLVCQKKSENIPHGKETILLVEDESGVRNVAASLLRKQGYQVLEVQDAEEALLLFSGKTTPAIDLLVTDVVLPKMNGKELFNSVQTIYPGMKALFMSGYTRDTKIFDQLGKVHFLQKPFKPAALGFKVREILDCSKGVVREL